MIRKQLMILVAFALIISESDRLPAQKTARFQPSRSVSGVVAAFRQLVTVPFKGKQDDVFFIDRKVGWYGNGEGKLYRTIDGGSTWDEQWSEPGTFIRALGFLDRLTGVLGNVGTEYFPGVTDETPLYITKDGGETWNPVPILGPTPKGICAIDVQRIPFINHGVLGEKVVVWAGGRVGGPAYLLDSHDNGASFESRDMSAQTAMILDVKFTSPLVGYIAGATSAEIEKSHALILRTGDGGRSWQKVYESKRAWEITWKLSFPDPVTGYVTIQNYEADENNRERFVAKTTDSGLHWTEVPLATDHSLQEFGVGFVTPERGWIGGNSHSFETSNGGRTWSEVDIGRVVNKFRIVSDKRGTDVFAIGSSLYKATIKTAPEMLH